MRLVKVRLMFVNDTKLTKCENLAELSFFFLVVGKIGVNPCFGRYLLSWNHNADAEE
jgi:hypothetical protein